VSLLNQHPLTSMAILEERGLFWWDIGKLKDNVLAPDSYVAGVLTMMAARALSLTDKRENTLHPGAQIL
jgi:hypothetical protein